MTEVECTEETVCVPIFIGEGYLVSYGYLPIPKEEGVIFLFQKEEGVNKIDKLLCPKESDKHYFICVEQLTQHA
jgi:hypothetical protein